MNKFLEQVLSSSYYTFYSDQSNKLKNLRQIYHRW